jgi:hypothetical protein
MTGKQNKSFGCAASSPMLRSLFRFSAHEAITAPLSINKRELLREKAIQM